MVRGQDIPSYLFTVSRPIVQELTPELTSIYGDRGIWTYDQYHEFELGLGTDYKHWPPFKGYLWSDQLAFPNANTPNWNTGVKTTVPSWEKGPPGAQ